MTSMTTDNKIKVENRLTDRGGFGRIKDMFSVFREWWILRQLRLKSRKGDIRLASRRIVNMDCSPEKEPFLFDISKRMLWIIPRKDNAQFRRISKDKKILDRSSKRNPCLVEEKTYLQLKEELLSNGKILDWFKEEGLNGGNLDSLGHESVKNDILLRITGDGDNFTFLVAFVEFCEKNKIIYLIIIGIVSYLSYLIGNAPTWLVSFMCKHLPIIFNWCIR